MCAIAYGTLYFLQQVYANCSCRCYANYRALFSTCILPWPAVFVAEDRKWSDEFADWRPCSGLVCYLVVMNMAGSLILLFVGCFFHILYLGGGVMGCVPFIPIGVYLLAYSLFLRFVLQCD